jgi:hypothetical protein
MASEPPWGIECQINALRVGSVASMSDRPPRPGYRPDGRRIRKKVSGATKGEVLRKLRDLRTELNASMPVPDDRLTVAAFLDRWLTASLPSEAGTGPYGDLRAMHASSDRRGQNRPLPANTLPDPGAGRIAAAPPRSFGLGADGNRAGLAETRLDLSERLGDTAGSGQRVAWILPDLPTGRSRPLAFA